MRALGLVGVWWGRPPGPRPTPPLAFVNRRKKPARGPAADQGVCPTMLHGLSSRPFSRESQAADVHRRLAPLIMTDNLATIHYSEIDRVIRTFAGLREVEAALRTTLYFCRDGTGPKRQLPGHFQRPKAYS